MLGRITLNNKILAIIFSGLVLIIIAMAIIIALINNNILFGNGIPKNCADLSGPELSNCISNESFIFFSQGDCVKALEVYENISPNSIDLNTLSQIYSYAVSASMDCNDQSAIEKWQNKRWETTLLMESTKNPL